MRLSRPAPPTRTDRRLTSAAAAALLSPPSAIIAPVPARRWSRSAPLANSRRPTSETRTEPFASNSPRLGTRHHPRPSRGGDRRACRLRRPRPNRPWRPALLRHPRLAPPRPNDVRRARPDPLTHPAPAPRGHQRDSALPATTPAGSPHRPPIRPTASPHPPPAQPHQNPPQDPPPLPQQPQHPPTDATPPRPLTQNRQNQPRIQTSYRRAPLRNGTLPWHRTPTGRYASSPDAPPPDCSLDPMRPCSSTDTYRKSRTD